jgi:hypothetical protein
VGGRRVISTHGHQVKSQEKEGKKKRKLAVENVRLFFGFFQARVEYIILLAKAVVL